MKDPMPSDFEAIKQWPIFADPFASQKEYAHYKFWLRWIKPSQWRAHFKATRQRTQWIQNSNLEGYFSTANRSLSRDQWEFLKLRKKWNYPPLHWDRFLESSCKRIIDIGCGDGDFIQHVIDYVHAHRRSDPLEIVGIDFNKSRIKNAKQFCHSTSPARLTFKAADVNQPNLYPDQHFDYGFLNGVLENLSDDSASKIVESTCRMVKKGIYIEDNVTPYPGGHPRKNIEPFFQEHGFHLVDKFYILSEPFHLFSNPDPLEVWPIFRSQIAWLERQEN